jgi:hypothetical protein
MLLAIYSSVIAIGIPVLERTRPTAPVAEGLRAKLAANDEVALYGLERWRSSLRYYVQQPLLRLRNPEEVAEFLRGNRGYVLMLDRDLRCCRTGV